MEALEGVSPGFVPLVTPANVLPGTKFGGEFVNQGSGEIDGIDTASATPDLSHVVFNSLIPLTQKASEANLENGLYDWSNGRLELISTLPGGEAIGGTLGNQ